MTYPKISSILFIFSLLIFTGCGNDDDSSEPITPDGFMVNSISGDNGTKFEIKKSGATETCTGEQVFGWESGNLLGSRRFTQIRMGCGENEFAFRLTLPPGTVFENIAVGVHELFETHLLLENTPDVAVVYPELYINMYNPPIKGNARGTVEIRRDVVILGTTYSLVGNIDATFYNAGIPVTVKGQFWRKDASWE